MPKQSKRNFKDLARYAGLATEIVAAIGIAVFLGVKADKWFGLRFPIFVIILPLLVIFFIMYKVIKDTSNKK